MLDFLSFIGPFFPIAHMVSAHGKNDRYMRYLSAISEGPLRVTAELTEMVQYCDDMAFGYGYRRWMIHELR